MLNGPITYVDPRCCAMLGLWVEMLQKSHSHRIQWLFKKCTVHIMSAALIFGRYCSVSTCIQANCTCGRLTNSSRIYFLFPVGKVSTMGDPKSCKYTAPNGCLCTTFISCSSPSAYIAKKGRYGWINHGGKSPWKRLRFFSSLVCVLALTNKGQMACHDIKILTVPTVRVIQVSIGLIFVALIAHCSY